MVQKSTKQEFVLKARQKHNDLDASCYKYDYDLFIYVNNHTKGIISCREHGTFNQTPVNHLSGKGCKKCANKALAKLKADSPEQFFEKANKKHNFRYNYERFIYTDSQTKGTIICSEHGAFDQRPANHILGAGCPKCGIIQRAIAATKNHEKFIEEGNLIHDSKYKYPEMYKSAYAKIKIECPIHGIFIQTPQDHVNGNGCIKCAGSYKPSHEEFIAKANLTHKYKYKYKSTYNGCDVKICITCAIHGDFGKHLTFIIIWGAAVPNARIQFQNLKQNG